MLREKLSIDYLNYLVLLIVGTLFILIFSSVSSPLTEDYSADSSIFIIMGKMFLNGKVPYVDFFDHKGPSLILLQAIGQIFIPYRSGIFLLEIINLFLALLVVYSIGRLILDRKLALTVCFFFLFFLSRLFNMGNTTEEFSLVPLLIAVYFTCKVFFTKCDFSPKIGFVIGLCFSFLFWLRINNAGAIVACCIFLFLYFLMHKDIKSLINLILFFIIGQLPFTVLYGSYFLYHGGLYEMIYATFLFNFLYVEGLVNFNPEHNWVNCFLAISLFLGSFLYFRRTKDWTVLLFSVALLFITMFTINIGPAYNHYYLLAAPAFVFALVVGFSFFQKKAFKLVILVLGVLLLTNTLYKGYLHHEAISPKAMKDYSDGRSNLTYLLGLIPEEEKKELFIYNVGSSIYPMMQIDPNYKYFVFQEWHGETDPNIYKEINSMMNNEKPSWVLLQSLGDVDENLDKYKNTVFADIVKNDYHLVEVRSFYALYELNETH